MKQYSCVRGGCLKQLGRPNRYDSAALSQTTAAREVVTVSVRKAVDIVFKNLSKIRLKRLHVLLTL